MWKGFSKEGGVDTSSYLVGSWSELVGAIGANYYYIGNCPEGTLEISREYYTHEDTSFPRKVDLVVAVRAGMKFSGTVEEIHKQNVSWLLGQSFAPGAVDYLYVGALETSYFFTFRGRRMRVSDEVAIEFGIWKAMVSSVFSLASGDETQGSPLEVTGLDDSDGDYGGSSTKPIGYIYVPAKKP